jgi:hypothetical protein
MKRYTEQELRAMPLRELDAVAAEVVMGWTQHPHMDDCWATSLETGADRLIPFSQKHYWLPSTSIADAMTLDHGISEWEIDGGFPPFDDGAVRVCFSHHEKEKSWKVVVYDDSLPLAITLASILAAQENDNA